MNTATASTSYSVLWGTQLAMTTALAGVMGGLSLQLRQPMMRSLAVHWVARLVVVAINLLYYLSDDPGKPALVPAALLFGAACGTLLLSAQWTIRDAVPEAPPAHVLRPLPVLLVFTSAAGAAHLYNITQPTFSPAFAAIWTRGLFGVAYLALLAWALLRWLDYPAARHRLTPILISVALTIGFDLFDAVQRGLVLTGGAPFGSHLLTIVLSLTGTLCLGIGTLLAALESERDVLRDTAEQLRVAQLEQAEAQRLQSLGQLARGVAHDFNNVLGLIVNGIEFVQGALGPDQSAAHNDLREMRSAVDRGTSLTRRLLDFARPSQSVGPISPAAVLDECLPMLRRLLSSRIELRATVKPTVSIGMDRTQFEQLVINLLVNARDATTGKGIVRLQLDEEMMATSRSSSVGRLTPGPWVRLTIVDDGTGIAAAAMPSLFQPFFTTKGAKGTGLGLATVSAAVHEVGGAIDVYSTPGRGARFDIWFPASKMDMPIKEYGKPLQLLG